MAQPGRAEDDQVAVAFRGHAQVPALAQRHVVDPPAVGLELLARRREEAVGIARPALDRSARCAAVR